MLPAGAAEGLAGRPHRRHRRRGAGQALRLEGRRHHPAAGHDLPAEGRQQRLAAEARAASSSVDDSKRKGEENQLLFHWKYFDEANDYVNGMVGWYIVQLDNADHATRVAKAIDAISAELRPRDQDARPKQAFNQSFAKQFADIGLIVTAIMGAVFFTLLLLTGNTMAQAVRERIPELAVLKTHRLHQRHACWAWCWSNRCC